VARHQGRDAEINLRIADRAPTRQSMIRKKGVPPPHLKKNSEHKGDVKWATPPIFRPMVARCPGAFNPSPRKFKGSVGGPLSRRVQSESKEVQRF
jgi:hypothetical protein